MPTTKKSQAKTQELTAPVENWLISNEGVVELKTAVAATLSSGVKPQLRTDVQRVGAGLILPIHGPVVARSNWITELLGIVPTETHLERLQTAIDDDEQIIIDIDTHGGSAALAFEFADLIYQHRDRITTYTGGHATSAGQLFHAAGGTRIAHSTAMMGSIGVVLSVGYDGGDRTIYSDNAPNKKGTRENLTKYANKLEASFLSYMSRFTGLTEDEVIQAGDRGGIITGADAKASGLITHTGTFQEAKQGLIRMDEEEKQKLTTATQTAMNARWAACMAVGASVELTQKIASNMAFNDEQAVDMLKQLKAETAAPVAPDSQGVGAGGTAAPAPSTPGATAAAPASDTNAAALALLQKMQAALSGDVNGIPSNPEDRREAEAAAAKAKADATATEAEAAKKSFETRMANMARRTGYRNPAATAEGA